MSCWVVSPVAGCVVVAINCSLLFSRWLLQVDLFALALPARLAAVHNSVENNVAHLLGERFGIAIDPRLVPGVDPVDHAEHAHHRGARVEIEAALAPQVFHQSEADAVVLALDAGDLGTQAVLQRLVFMREHLQPLLIAYKIFEVIQDEDADALLGIRDILKPRFELFENGGESVLLNHEQQALFGFEVVIKPRQGHAGGAGKIAHGSAFVSLEAKDLGRVIENLPEATVETGPGGRTRLSAGTPGSTSCGQGGHMFE